MCAPCVKISLSSVNTIFDTRRFAFGHRKLLLRLGLCSGACRAQTLHIDPCRFHILLLSSKNASPPTCASEYSTIETGIGSVKSTTENKHLQIIHTPLHVSPLFFSPRPASFRSFSFDSCGRSKAHPSIGCLLPRTRILSLYIAPPISFLTVVKDYLRRSDTCCHIDPFSDFVNKY